MALELGGEDFGSPSLRQALEFCHFQPFYAFLKNSPLTLIIRPATKIRNKKQISGFAFACICGAMVVILPELGRMFICRNCIQQTQKKLRNDSSIPENLLDLFAVKSFLLEFVTPTEKPQRWHLCMGKNIAARFWNVCLRSESQGWSTCSGWSGCESIYVSHGGNQKPQFQWVFKGIKWFWKIFAYLNISTFFRMDRKNRIQKRLRDLRQGILTFTRFSGLKIDGSKGFPMHHWRLQQQRCGGGGGGVCYWSWTCF